MNEQDLRDLGFGSVVSRESKARLVNRDGSFNVQRSGLSFWQYFSPYHFMLTIPWWQFFGHHRGILSAGQHRCSPGATSPADPTPWARFTRDWSSHTFLRAFFFSVQTLSTIGYGQVFPVGLGANALVTLEALVGLIGFAIVTGLLFARFSRPNAKLLFSSTP